MRTIETVDLSTMPTLGGHTVVWSLNGNWSHTEASHPHSGVKARLFAQIGRLYFHVVTNLTESGPTPLLGHYPGDLYHDAWAVEEMTFKPGQYEFVYDADLWGTHILTRLPDGAWPESHRKVRFRCSVWAEPTLFSTHPWYMAATCVKWDV